MEIALEYTGVYADHPINHHMMVELEFDEVKTIETSRGNQTRSVKSYRSYAIIEGGQTIVKLCEFNVAAIDGLIKTGLFEFQDAGQAKLVDVMRGAPVVDNSQAIEAVVVETVVEAPVVETPVVVVEKVDEETDLSADALSRLTMADLKKLAVKQNIKPLPTDKKVELIAKIIEG